MISAAELRVNVGVYGIPEANRKLLKFDGELKALASSDPTVTLHAQVDDAGFEAAGIKKAIFEEGVTTSLKAEVDNLGFEEGALKKAIFGESVTTELHADTSGFEKVWGQLEAIRAATSKPIVQEVELKIDKSSLAALGVEEALVGAGNGNGGSNGNGNGAGFLGALIGSRGGGGKGFLPTLLWGGHSPGGRGPLWTRALLGGGLLAGAGSLGALAGMGAEHFLFTGLGLAGSAGSAALGGGLIGAGALGTMAVGSGSDMAVMKTTIAQTKELGAATQAVQQAMALYGAHSKQAATAVAHLKLLEQEMGGGKGVHAERVLAERGDALGEFWKKETQEARVQASHILDQVVGLGHHYVPLVAHAAERNLSIVDKGLKPLFSWLEGPEGVGIFHNLENEFAHNLPHAMHAFDQGAQFVLKTVNVASQYTGGFTAKLDEFFTRWNEPQNFKRWEGEIGHLVGDFHLWMTLIKELGRDIFDLFSQDAHTGNAIVQTITGMLHKLGEWERSVSGKQELHNLFVVHREEIIQLLHVLPPLIGAISPIYMTVAPFATEAMTELLGVLASFLKMLDETGPVTRWALGIGLIATKLFGFKAIFGGLGKLMLSPFESLLAKAPLIGGFFGTQVSETEALTTATEGLTTAVGELTLAYERMGMAAGTAEGIAAAGGPEGVAGGLFAASAAGTGAGTVTAADAAGTGAGAGFLGKAVSSPFAKAGAVAGGYFLAEFAAKLAAPGALEGQGLWSALTHGFNTKDVAQTEARALGDAFVRELHHALAHGGSPGDLLGASHNRARTISAGETQAIRTEAHVLDSLRSGLVTRMSDIRKLAQEGSLAAAAAFGKGSPQWRAASADNMHAAVEAIKAGEDAGLISTEDGQRTIAHYMREYHLLSGKDPFHIAESFTSSWREAGHVSETGISNALAELRKMPPASEAIAEQVMLHQVRAYERGGELATGTFSRLRSAIVTELQRTREHGGAQVERFSEDLIGTFGSMSAEVAAALEAIGGNTSRVLKALGATALPHFHLKTTGVNPRLTHADQEAFKAYGHQRGGHIDAGAPSGDTVPAMLERGEYVLNRNAVAAVGVHNLNALNYGAHARFQTGGHVGGLGSEPHLLGPGGAMHTLGQRAIHDAYAAAEHYVAKHRPKTSASGIIGGLNVPTGPIEQMAKEMILRTWGPSEWAPFAAVEMREAGWNPHAQNPTSTAYGLAQNLNPATYPAAGRPGSKAPLLEQAKAQLQWMVSYIKGRYGTPSGAWAHEQSAGWYQQGGLVDPRQPLSPAAHRAYLADKWAHGVRPLGGLVEAAEHELGVPQSPTKKHRPHEHATASDAVHWAMRHLGQTNNYGYPGEWCGAFIAADMKAIGLPVPSGYPAAINWATYGTPLGKNHIQAGAILDYGSAHVAMAISSSEQIQGNDIHGAVGTSGIGGVIGGSSLTAVRWPPYGTGPTAGSKIAEKVPKRAPFVFKGGIASTGGGIYAPGKGKVSTAKLSFGALPSTLRECRKELAQRRSELAQYRRALSAAKIPAERHALQVNVNLLTNRIQALLRVQSRLVAKAAKEKALHKIGGRGAFPEIEAAIQGKELAYNKAQEVAEQVVDLEPIENATSYIEGPEANAYGTVLAREADWRNSILGGEGAVVARIASLRAQIAAIKALRAKHPRAYAKQKFRIPALEKAISAARSVYDPGRQTGTFEEALHNVQGFFGGREPLASLPTEPVAGSFGGLIFQTQMSIHELGLKIAGGGTGAGGGTEREHLLEELLTQANQREMLSAMAHGTLSPAHILPYAGPYAAGGVVAALVGEQGPEVAAFPTGTRIHTAGETSSMLAPKVVVNVYEGDGTAKVEINDEKVEAVVNRMDRRGARTARRGLARAGA